jgi:nucleotide-binding universal stress UspA family protein
MNWLPRKKVVVPFDFSEDSATALATAIDMADQPAHIHLVHVLPFLEPTEPGVMWEVIDEEARRESVLESLRRELARIGGTGEEVIEVIFGDPGHEIVDYADRVDAGLIVVSSHGRSGLKRLLLGSVAERVVRLAHCPVLMLKTGRAVEHGDQDA